MSANPCRVIAVVVLWLAPLAAVAAGADITASVIDERGQAVADAVIVAVPADGAAAAPTAEQKKRVAIIDEIHGDFSPRVRAIPLGSSVRFPNRDNIRHQIYSFSPTKRFELPLYPGVAAAAVRFDTAGVVVLGCNVHEWMVAYVYVSESPYFARTDAGGKAHLRNLPQRAYVLRAWHPQMTLTEAATRKNVDLSHARSVAVAWTLTLKPELRARHPAEEPGSGH